MVTLGLLLLIAAIISFLIGGAIGLSSTSEFLAGLVFGIIAAIGVDVMLLVSWFIVKGINAP